MGDNNISSILSATMEKIRSIIDSETIVGNPITVGEITIIPVSKVSFGLASGGSDFSTKNSQDKMFGGGGGAGASVTPVVFLVVKGNDVKVLSANDTPTPIEKAIGAVPELVDKFTEIFKKDAKDSE